MKIRCRTDWLDNCDNATEIKDNSFSVLSNGSDGRSLYDITLNDDGSLTVKSGVTCKHNNVVLDDNQLIIRPMCKSEITINRVKYKNG